MSNSLWPHGTWHARPPCPLPTPGTCSNSCPSSKWCCPNISSSAGPFSCFQSFPASGSFSMSQFFTPGSQSIGPSASASVFPMNIQSWYPLGSTGLTSLLSRGFSKIFSSTTIQKHQFFSAQPSLWLNSYLYMRVVIKNLGVGDGQGGLACCSSWGRKESDMTEQLNWR